ncbi:hypothetical protein [Pseudomonas sp. GD03696]|uniref:hypothetical protein n=1 Tax=Pseudomonas sp. GD03696 TaxID=2975368 RepID=UPI00244B1C4B|nr:hypothetical protein [Pseudomonas sp. GD03696]MDH1932805.1 hypothetical protein [Pseudomonas sp. GD03696]
MKSILGTTALAALMTAAAVTTVQAEGGSDRLIEYRLQQAALVSNRSNQDADKVFVQMIKQQPTAAGTAPEQQQDRQIVDPKPSFKSPIVRDRELYGSPK